MTHHAPHPIFAARASAILYQLAMSVPATHGAYLLPANVCPVVPLTLLAAHRAFEFIDLDATTLSMSPALVRQRLTAPACPPIAGILFVRPYGAMFDMTAEFQDWKTAQPGVLLIDDRCLARPVLEKDAVEWQGADAILFSTGYAKPVDVGFGGFAHLQPHVSFQWHHRPFDPAHEQRVTALYKAHIQQHQPLYEATAATAPPRHLQTCQWLDTSEPTMSWSTYRERVLRARADAHTATILQVYRRHILEAVHLPSAYHSWRFQIRVPRRDTLLKQIFATGFFASDHYFPAATLFGGHPCPVATALSADIVNLFHDFRVSLADADQIGKLVRAHLLRAEEEGA
jgi:hypothetical protein